MDPLLYSILLEDYFKQTCPLELQTLFFQLLTMDSLPQGEEKEHSRQEARQEFHQAIFQYQSTEFFPERWIDDADLPF